MVSPEVEAFLNARADYDEDHVRIIEDYNFVNGVPFCAGCADWHHPSELHSIGNQCEFRMPGLRCASSETLLRDGHWVCDGHLEAWVKP